MRRQISLALVLVACGKASEGSHPVDTTPLPDTAVDSAPKSDTSIGPPVDAGPELGLHLALGFASTCALLPDGTVECWGDNRYGGVGSGSPASSVGVPTRVSGLTDVVQLAAGRVFNCARRKDGSVSCWGGIEVNDSGIPTKEARTPVAIEGIANAADIAAGSFHACVRVAGGASSCWGSGVKGQLGDGSIGAGVHHAVPSAVSVLPAALQFALSEQASIALIADGTLRAWGTNNFNVLNLTDEQVLLPKLAPPSGVVQIAAGDNHACARTVDGSAMCWGHNESGQVGIGSRSPAEPAAKVPGLSGILQIAAGRAHTCAVLSDRTISCWGSNESGQLGLGTSAAGDFRLNPITVPGLTDVAEVSLGATHTCAARVDGQVYCWGEGYIGDGTITPHPSPFLVKL